MAYSTLSFSRILRPGSPPDPVTGSSVTARESTDLVVDGRSLIRSVSDDVASCLGWGDVRWENEVIDKLLLLRPADFEGSRVALLICPECGDLGCGAVTCRIERQGAQITWSAFGWEDNWSDEPVRTSRYGHLGPFTFEFSAYEKALRESVRLVLKGAV
jgi:hypothetical protein